MCQTFIKGPRGLAPARAGFEPCGSVNAEIWESGLFDFHILVSLSAARTGGVLLCLTIKPRFPGLLGYNPTASLMLLTCRIASN